MRATFPYVPLDDKSWRWTMGLRPLDLDAWFEIDEDFDEQQRLKSSLLETKYEVVVATQREGDDASRELLDEVRNFVRSHAAWTRTPSNRVEHPIVAASRLVQEDLCVLVKDDAWRLRAACVCFPSRWSLVTKLGATLDEIHSPVPLYDEQLSHPTSAFFDRLDGQRSYWRLNWTLLDSPVLHQPMAPRREPEGGLDQWFFRVERQTLRRLSLTGAVVFTIRTYVASALALRARDDAFVPMLLHSMESAPPLVRAYKGWTGVSERLRDALVRDE